MASSEQHDSASSNLMPVRFENLEERLLLTTLTIGNAGHEIFIYQNSQLQNVRIDFYGSLDDKIELMSVWDATAGLFDPTTDVVDLVGLRMKTTDPNGINDPANWDVINWPDIIWMPDQDGIPRQADPNIIDPLTGDWATWTPTYTEAQPPDTPEVKPIRGAATEIFGIWGKQCSANARLVISTLASKNLINNTTNDLFTNLNTWESDAKITLFWDGDTAITPLTGSGGVVVGAWPDVPEILSEETLAYIATSDSVSSISPGITISDGTLTVRRNANSGVNAGGRAG